MNTVNQYIIDAFTDKVFAGNPAAVCILDEWLPDEMMRKIAMENNLSETAFTVKESSGWRLRWFTPGDEINLCGHATLATAYAIMNFAETGCRRISFNTLSGVLTIKQENGLLAMDFPSMPMSPIDVTDDMAAAIGIRPAAAYLGEDMVCVMEDEEQVKKAVPDLGIIRSLKGMNLHITAKGKEYDCVTRTFAPKFSVAEDPVCGRAHCFVVPLWAKTLHKDELTAYQASSRGGILYCRYGRDRTILRGKAALFAKAQLFI